MLSFLCLSSKKNKTKPFLAYVSCVVVLTSSVTSVYNP